VKRVVAPLVGDNCCLRMLEENDIERLRRWRNQDAIRKWFVQSDPISPEQQRSWWEKYRHRADDYVFVIEETAENMGPVGSVALYNIDMENKRAEYGRLMIGEGEAHGKGLAKAATRLLLQFAFDQLGLNEVYLDVFPDNGPAIAVYRDCGFKQAGCRNRLLRMRVFRQEHA